MNGVPLFHNEPDTWYHFKVLYLRRNRRFVERRSWHVDGQIHPDILRDAYAMRKSSSNYEIVLDNPESTTYIELDAYGELMAKVATSQTSSIEAEWRKLTALMPEAAPAPTTAITMTYVNTSRAGTMRRRRTIDAPTWVDIAPNYGPHTAAELDYLVHRFEPGIGGKLMLWHGPPGTGKTFAIRALCQAWREWCEPEFIVDPELLFGQGDYLLDVLMGSDGYRPGGQDPWRLLILEDTGELLAADAKQRTGQGLSRLLNLVDGMLGQGLRVLVLITTNEEIGALHPAVSRPGRAAIQLPFEDLPQETAAAWAEAHGIAAPDGSRRLADLFAEAERFHAKPEPKRRVGFAA